METQSNCLFITFVEKEGPFLKVWGQTDKNTSLYIEQVLHSFTTQFDNGFCIPHPESLQIGILCCAKYKDNKYYRARITNLNYLHNRYIEVNFVDYGHQDVVPVSNIRSLEGFDTAFISIQPQASNFLLAEAVCPRGEWNEVYLEEICKEIRYTEVNFSIIGQVTKHYLVRLFVGVNDLAIILISKGLMRHTSLTTQEAVLLSMMPRAPLQPPATPQQNIATYKAFTLEPGSQYEVYVSYVTDGPCNFSVQLKQSEEVLGKLMKEINSMTLTPIEGIPIPGTVCLARCTEDGHICRAVVTNEVDGQFKVFYVDFGNFEVISLESLYEIPFKFVIPKVMAIRFALAGVEKSTVTLEMQCAFKQFVDNRLIHMKVMPMTTRTSLPRCELWDPESGINALDIVTKAASSSYPDHISLHRGFTQTVKISFVFSCNRFYVQLKAKQDDLLRLMLDIQVLCREADSFKSNMVKVGLPCYALYEGDQQWYRSQIVEVLGAGQVKVHYVDYGNEEVVSVNLLKPIEGKQLTILRPQAIECCLNGYQNMEPDLERDNLLEELILEQEFTMKVVEMQGKKALVELIDSANYNVASLLLDKIAVTRSQVSPMLVQAGNKIEHRKYSQPFNSREQPERTDQRKPGSRDSFESTETNENNTWRQNNKGFNKNYDRNKRDELNDSTDSERHSTKSFNRNDRNRNESNTRNTEGGPWKQNSGFNKSQDRFSRDRNNRNNDWGGNGDERKNFREKDSWGGGRTNDQQNNFKEKGDWGSGNDQQNINSPDDGWGSSKENNRQTFNPRGRKGDWDNNRENDKRNFNSRENNDWGDNKQDKEWGGRGDRKGFQPRDRDNFKPRKRFDDGNSDWNNGDKDGFKPRKRFEDGGGDWNADSTHKSGGFKKREFKRETSELSSSGSEKSFRKGAFKDNFRKNKPDFKKPDRSPRGNFVDDSGDTWNVSASTTIEVPNAAPSTAKFTTLNVDNTEATVVISWFHNPSQFYCQIESTQDEFKRMMEEIQQAYKGRQPGTAAVGAPVIGLFPEDRVLYRAEVLETLASQYKVYYVDFGNVSVIDKVWPIETRFMELPAQAICCKLSGIEPPTDTWPEANNYGQYFDKKQFFCKFISTEDTRVAIQLESNKEDIASLLLRDGLAKACAPPPEPELPLLIGQQFRALLLSVNSLGDFLMSLQNGALLKCTVFNLSQSTETWEDNLKDKINQILIVYVDDLKEDRLEVTLYDQNGAKIKLIDKDEGAYESVELLCPYLILHSQISGEIAHIEETTVYLQPADCAENIQYFLNTAFEYYESFTLEEPITPTESFVYAVKSSDTNWYRGRVVSLDDKQVMVNYLDYGNSEQVNFDVLRELTAEFMEIPILCIPITIKDTREELIGKFVSINLTFTETGVEGAIQEEVVTTVPTQETPKPNLEEVTQTEETQKPNLEELIQTEQIPTESVTCGTQVVLSHTDSPSDFYLQLAESIGVIEELQARIQEQIPEMADIENPVIGALCAAPYTVDQQWYRAQVLDADSDITTVRFVDYGNTDVLDNHTTRVKTLPTDLLSLEVHATRCRLKIKPIDEEWTTVASERFEQLASVENLTAQFISQDEKTNYVELYSDGANVREILISENLAFPDEVVPEASSTLGFVSHLNSPSEFWIQFENCVEGLEWVAEQLSGAETFQELEDLSPGVLCAALFPDDQMWYRARILSNTVAGIEVLFVDYGNSCTSCSLRDLPEDLVMLPPLAQKCSLQKPESLTTWGPEMVRKFIEISADGQTTFHVNKLSTGETASVVLLLDGVDVTTLIVPQTEEVQVKSFEGLDEIVLVKGGEELQTKFKLEPLPDIAWSEESIKKFAEMTNDENTVFQAEFVSDDTVRLYLGLNDIRLELNGIKSTTPASSPLKTRINDTHSTDETSTSGTEPNLDGNEGFVKGLVEGIIEGSTNPHECVEENVCDEECKNIIRSLLTDIIEASTNQSESNNQIENKQSTNHDIDLSVKSTENPVQSEEKVPDEKKHFGLDVSTEDSAEQVPTLGEKKEAETVTLEEASTVSVKKEAETATSEQIPAVCEKKEPETVTTEEASTVSEKKEAGTATPEEASTVSEKKAVELSPEKPTEDKTGAVKETLDVPKPDNSNNLDKSEMLDEVKENNQ
ncbi:maternal protein tudor-like isoform X2 [Tribolium madens]|uniref:maternal protein tudor-like isoform X2 n=1 Tax=Tribolium madens TaxID=41895 RepID=UPI001CF74A82|nr:maternal protein tudor-like isoform X2 [Tribolium madens]